MSFNPDTKIWINRTNHSENKSKTLYYVLSYWQYNGADLKIFYFYIIYLLYIRETLEPKDLLDQKERLAAG